MAQKTSKRTLKVMNFGTFDIIHPGHIFFLKESKKHGYLITVVARDKNVIKTKGQPTNDENTRLENLTKLNIANEVVLGNNSHKRFEIIQKYRPDIICLGYDQNSMGVETQFPNIKIIKIKPYKENLYKSSILKQQYGNRHD